VSYYAFFKGWLLLRVCIIEAMKLMNDLPAEVSGRIVKVCVESGTTVEYGQPLFMVNPKV
jgi:acetyl-CoA carboxylase biotin carboxyl carrier protein